MAAAQLPRNPLHTPPACPQPHHPRHVIRRLHHLPPWIIPRRAFSDSFPLHSLSPQLSEEGAIPRDAEGAVFHGARHRSKRSARRHSLCPSKNQRLTRSLRGSNRTLPARLALQLVRKSL